MSELQHRHDMSDKLWDKIEPLLSGTKVRLEEMATIIADLSMR